MSIRQRPAWCDNAIVLAFILRLLTSPFVSSIVFLCHKRGYEKPKPKYENMRECTKGFQELTYPNSQKYILNRQITITLT
jgi:hypothetical protein